MKIKSSLFLFLFILIPLISLTQTATLKGIILDENNVPISNVSITFGTEGTTTNTNGFYFIKIPSNQDVTIEFSHLSLKKITVTFNLKNGETFEFNPVMNLKVEQIATVVVKGNERKRVEGIITIDPELIDRKSVV